jgi:hypothetical protein
MSAYTARISLKESNNGCYSSLPFPLHDEFPSFPELPPLPPLPKLPPLQTPDVTKTWNKVVGIFEEAGEILMSERKDVTETWNEVVGIFEEAIEILMIEPKNVTEA